MRTLPVHVNTDTLLVGPYDLSVLVPSMTDLDHDNDMLGTDDTYQKRSCSQV